MPPIDHLNINFSAPYGEDTFVYDTDMNTITMSSISGADIPVIPEFTWATLLVLISVTTTMVAITPKRSKS
jgi:hypothetical protein